MQDKTKHLEFVQNVITRMNTNSFQLKGWMITIVSALLALYASSSNSNYVFVAIVPAIVFWFLDAYYLQQERKFRGLHEDIVNGNDNIKPFSMSISDYKYDKTDSNSKSKSKKYCYWNVFFSPTILPLYGIIVVALIVGGVLVLKGII